MGGRAKKPGAAASPGGRQCPESHISASLATRYLSAAPHLRRGMLGREIIEPGRIGPRRPRPVGRSFAVRALFGADGAVPMPAVDTKEVRRQCAIALLQTVIRDLVVVAAVAVSAVLQPWGTVIVFGFAIVVIVLIGRVGWFSWWTIAAVAAGLLLLFTGIYRGRLFLAIPLICLGACFVVYLADTLLSIQHVRRLWRRSASGQESRLPDSEPAGPSGSTSEKQDENGGPSGQDGEQAGLDRTDDDRRGLRVSDARRAYHDNHRIIGAGTSLRKVEFDVGLQKQLDAGKPIERFKTSELIMHIGFHVISQGVGESQGYAYGIWSPTDMNATSESHFTYGLSNLNVGSVIAFPVPKTRKHPLLRVVMVKLNYYDRPSGEYLRDVIDRSPIGQPERHYVCASISSWEGELVTSVYFSVALVGHRLILAIHPYVLAPIVPDLRIADDLATQNPVLVTCKAVAMTARQFAGAAQRMGHLPREAQAPGEADGFMSGMRSVRERYSQVATDHMHQAEDASRIIRVLESNIIAVTMNYLRDHNIDITEDEQRALNLVQTYTIFGDGVINTGDNSQVNNAKGDGNNQTNTSNGTRG
jgi:hypothetical protein